MVTESLNERLDIPGLTMTLGAILLLECWNCFKMKSHTNVTQAKDAKAQAFGLLYLVSCISLSYSPHRRSTEPSFQDPKENESKTDALERSKHLQAMKGRKSLSNLPNGLALQLRPVIDSKTFHEKHVRDLTHRTMASNSTILKKSALECLSLSSIMLDKLLGETNLLFDH